MLTRSPATIPWPTAPIVTAASPVRTPARSPDGGAGLAARWRTASTRSRPVRTARSASSSWRDRRAPDGHHRVADVLLDRAAVPLHDLPAQVEVAGERSSRTSSGSRRLGERREADEVGEEDRDEAPVRHRRAARPPVRPRRRGATGRRPAPAGARRRLRPEPPAALAAELRRGGFGTPQAGQSRGEARAALQAELPPGMVLRAAAAAGHSPFPSTTVNGQRSPGRPRGKGLGLPPMPPRAGPAARYHPRGAVGSRWAPRPSRPPGRA